MPLAIPFEQFPGLGHEDYPGFPTAECPPLPDLSRHCSVCADVLKAHPELYEQLKARATSKGVTLARCIKTGIDNRGHPVLKSLGAVAGDAECYDTFAPLFDKLIESRHGKVRSAESKPFGRRTLTTESAEPFDGYAISCKVTASRSIDGFRFPPAATRQDREEVERMLVDSAASMEGSLKGQYFPLMGSNSYPSKPGGMSATEEKMLADDHLLFYHPDAPAVLSTGSGRHWPHGRGVFVNARKTLTLWINEEEHLKATSQRAGGNVQAAYQELHAVLEQLSSKLPGRTFATSPRLGYLTSNPAILGTAMRVSAIVKLPLLKQSKEELQRWCASRRLVEKSAISQSGDRMIDLVEVSSRDKLNITQEETVDMLVEGIAQLVRAERLMEQGMSAAEALAQSRPRGDLTPVDPDPGCWDAAGNALRDMFSSAVLTSCGSELVGVPLETMQRLAGAFVVASEVGSLQDAAIGLQQARGATKIQALQRGRSERKLVEDAKGQKEVDSKARPATEDFEQLRVELREVLASAAQDGSLGRALAVPAEPEMADDEKEILRLQLESSLERGALAAALAEETEVIERDLEEVRLRMQSMLVQSLRDGALDAALQAVFSEQDQEDTRTIIAEQDLGITEDTEVECLRVRLAHQLQTSMMDGSLDAALAELTVESLDELRQRAASLLQSSFDNGQLQFVLSSRATEAAEAESLLALRSQAASQLLTALNDGSLEKALENTRSQDELRDRRLESLRHKVAGTLENALMDGSLQAALWNKEARKRDKEIVEDTKPSSEKHEGDVDALRQKAAVLLTTSCADGSLEAALSRKAVPSREKNGADVDAVRQKAAVLLTTSCADGSLEAALSRKAVPSREKNGADVDALRQKAAVLLTTSCADGSLEAALSRKAVSSTEKSDGDVDALRRNVAALLTASCADGSLEAALSSKASRDLEGIRNEVATLLEAATNDGSLEMAVKAVAGARSTEDEIESVRKKIAFRLQQSASDGTLGAALLTASRPESSEDLLFRMGQQLSEAFLDGTLEAALEATRSGDVPPARDNDDNMDHLKSMVAESLSSAFWDGSLEAALEASGSPPREQELGSQSTCQALAKPVRPPSAQARHGAAVLLKVMSTYDRRIGKLLEGIEASEREILARSQQMAMLQVQMEEAQSDLRSLELAWDKQQLALEREEVRDLKLHEESRTLRESLELEKLKQRHAALDQGHEMPYSSARSELTQAPSGRGLSSPPSTWRSHS